MSNKSRESKLHNKNTFIHILVLQQIQGLTTSDYWLKIDKFWPLTSFFTPLLTFDLKGRMFIKFSTNGISHKVTSPMATYYGSDENWMFTKIPKIWVPLLWQPIPEKQALEKNGIPPSYMANGLRIAKSIGFQWVSDLSSKLFFVT